MMPNKFNLDFSQLENSISPKKRVFRLEDVKDRLEKVAFDLVRFKDADMGAQLWQVSKDLDGQFIVALYQEDESNPGVEKTASKCPWEVFASSLTGDLQISFKGDPIAKLSSSKLGIPASEIHKVPSYLPEKLASSPKLVKALLSELSDSTKKLVLSKHPELDMRNING